MSIRTLLRCLIGNRDAILRIAGTPSAIWLGTLFVVSAGLAREYDAKDLYHEPWHLVVPLVASLVTSFLLFSLVFVVAFRKSPQRSPFWATYFPFLSLYWMTAPLAWLYAIPVDRFLSVEAATAANLALLGVVSVWRVSLMVRVVSTYFGATQLAAFWLVMLFADTVALLILYFTPLPIFNIMGGIALSESEQMIQLVAFWVGCLGVPLWLVWFGGVCTQYASESKWKPPQIAATPSGRVHRSLWLLAVGMIVGWAGVLPFTQSEQQHRWSVERALSQGRLREAIDTMSRLRQEDFPPHWDPPPWLAYHNPNPPLLDVLEIVLDDEVAANWVRAIYVNKMRSKLANRWFAWNWQYLVPAEKDRYLRVFEKFPSIRDYADQFSVASATEDDAARKQWLKDLFDIDDQEPVISSPATLSSPDPSDGDSD